MDLQELLPDVALLQCLQEDIAGMLASTDVPSCMQDVCDPLTWASSFVAFVATPV